MIRTPNGLEIAKSAIRARAESGSFRERASFHALANARFGCPEGAKSARDRSIRSTHASIRRTQSIDAPNTRVGGATAFVDSPRERDVYVGARVDSLRARRGRVNAFVDSPYARNGLAVAFVDSARLNEAAVKPIAESLRAISRLATIYSFAEPRGYGATCVRTNPCSFSSI
jgi:hypothetical protein